MAETIICDNCSKPLKRGDMVTVDVTHSATSYYDPSHMEHHFCDVVCLGWWAKDSGDEWGWFLRPRPSPRHSPTEQQQRPDSGKS